MSARTAQQIREGLDHPVIDADGHTIEVTQVLLDYLDAEGGPAIVDAYRRYPVKRQFVLREGDPARTADSGSWVWPTRNTLDRATATLPALYAERLGDLGIDFSIVYPSEGLFGPQIPDPELRRAACRAYNRYAADAFAPHAAKLTPAAVIPCHTPEEAVAELQFAVRELGLKAVVLRSFVKRPATNDAPERLDFLALGSDFDYDPVWAACAELGVAATFHSSAVYGGRNQIENYSYNHIGVLAAGGEAIAKALFMGGVTRRFPQCNFAFLEGGVGWAVSLYADLLGHWRRRNATGITAYDPAELDVARFMALVASHGDDHVRAHAAELAEMFSRPQPAVLAPDNFSAVDMHDEREILDLFVAPFWFGCEADDPVTVHAFDRAANPHGAALQAVLGSDNAHWDVTDMDLVLVEAREAVEHGLMSEADFRAFTFENTVRLHAGMNRAFFDGTDVQPAVDALLGDRPA